MRSGSTDDEIAPTLPASDAVDPSAATETPRTAMSGSGAHRSALTREEAGRYDRVSELGRGGMGRVILAVDQHLGREVAMKELLTGAHVEGASIGAITRFVREARVTGRLEHPSIVPVHELGQRADGTIYYTMKRIRGRSLASVLKQAKGIGARLELIGAFRDVCQAIAYAHARGVVHRDLKPDNVMVGEFGETLVVDWGLAKVRGEEEQPGTGAGAGTGSGSAETIDGHAIGTPAYMAPEQARGELAKIDERSDVWGLGAILFEILTGRAPFRGASALEILRKVLDERPPSVREVAPDAPRELAAIADRALAADPAARYASAKDLADEIEAYQSGRNVGAYEYSSWELVRRFVARNRAATLAAASVFVAAIAAAGLVYRSYLGELAQREAAVASDLRSRAMLAEALQERADHALAAGDAAAAAIYAAGALLRDPANPHAPECAPHALGGDEADRRRAQERIARAYSTYVEATSAQRYTFERRIAAPSGSAIAGDRVLATATDGISVIALEGGEARDVALPGFGDVTIVRPLPRDRALVASEARAAVIDLGSGAIEAELPPIVGAAAAEGRFFTLARDGRVIARSSDDLAELDAFDAGTVGRLSIVASRDGAALAIPESTDVLLFRMPGGTERAVIDAGAHTAGVAFSPDGRELAIARSDASLLVVDVATLAPLREVPTRSWPSGVSWIDDDVLAVSEDAWRAAIQPAHGGGVIETLHAPLAGAHVLHPAAEHLVDLPEPLPDREAIGSVFRRARAADARAVTFDEGVFLLAGDPTRDRVVAATVSTVRELGLTAEGLRAGPIHALPPSLGMPFDLAVAPDGTIAVITHRGAVVLFHGEGEPAEFLFGPDAASLGILYGVAFDPRSDVVYASSASTGSVHRWQRSEDQALPSLEGNDAVVIGLEVSPDGTLLATGSLDGTVRLFHLDDPSRAPELLLDQDALISHVAFSPDGTRLASADGDGWITVHAIPEGREVARFRPHERWVNRLAWWPDGRWIASASDDGTARVSAADGTAIDRIVPCATSCLEVAVARDGGTLVVHRDRSVVAIPVEPGEGTRDPRALLETAEARAGVRLHGLTLVAE